MTEGQREEGTKLRLFRRNFTLVAIGQIISLFGNAVLRFVLPLYLLRVTGSAALFGMVSACSSIPTILFSLIGGVLADRLNKQRIMVALDFSTAVLVLSFYLLHGLIPVVPLMMVCLMLLYGISGIYDPAVKASIPLLVEKEQLVRGNSVINIISTTASLFGPVLGGAVYGALGLTPVLLLSTVCFFCSGVMELFIRIPFCRRESAGSVFHIVGTDLSESWHYMRREMPVLIGVIQIAVLVNLILSSAVNVGIPIIVVNYLGMSDAAMGLTEGVCGLGGLMGGVLIGVLGDRLKPKYSWLLLLAGAIFTAGIGCSVLPGVSVAVSYGLVTVTDFVLAMTSAIIGIQLAAIIQRKTLSHLLGKVTALSYAVCCCAVPLGQAMFGLLFERFAGMPWVVMLGAAALSAVLALYSRRVFVDFE